MPNLIIGSLGALWAFFDRSPVHSLLISFQAIAAARYVMNITLK